MTSIWCSLTFWWRQLLRSLGLLWLWLGCLLMLWLLLLLWMMVILCWCLLKVLLLSSYRRLFRWRLKHFLLYFRLLFWRLILIHCWTTLSSFIWFFWFNLQKKKRYIIKQIPCMEVGNLTPTFLPHKYNSSHQRYAVAFKSYILCPSFLTLWFTWVTKTEFLLTISNTISRRQVMKIKENINKGYY